MTSFDDPEASYRRGYVHGAWQLYEQIDAYLPPAISRQARDWIERDLGNWRLENMRGESVRHPGYASVTNDIAPPDLKIR